MKLLIKYCLILIFLVQFSNGKFKFRRRRSTTDCPSEIVENEANFRVFLTVNALTTFAWDGSLQQRKLELNWTPPPDGVQNEDWIGLFQRGSRERTLARIRANNHSGYYKTDITFPRHPMMGMRSPKATCVYGFYIAYVRQNRTLKVNCMRLRPNWMYEDRHVIGDMPLHSLMIPGTHNAGAYDDNVGPSDALNLIRKFSINQDEDVWSQLLYGIRYLDLRVSHYRNTPEKFWAVHDFVKINPLFEIINDVRRFLRSTKEMVILDFHRFPNGFDGTNENNHAELLRYLKAEIGEFMAPDWLGRSVTLNDLWNMNKTLIVTYSHDPSSAFSEDLWSEVRHVWGNKRTANELNEFLWDSMILRRWARYPWAAMTHLTPSKMDVILNPNYGFRERSNAIARNVTQWYRQNWWNSANIVATDFFLGNNLIEESIIANRRRQKCRRQARFTW